ncbi:hypothetical protein [Natronorarus salvus]|uniref:hypothetical protein n=1 Tax=Natronorarus salvus TaxID=3117733 RepID=UPI002F269A55
MSSSTGFVELEEKIASIYNSPAFSEAVFARENQHKKLEQSLDDLAQAQSNQIQTALDNISYRHHLKVQPALESLHSRHQTISESTLELIDRRSRQHNLAIERIANNPEFSRALEESATIANSVGEINRKHFSLPSKTNGFHSGTFKRDNRSLPEPEREFTSTPPSIYLQKTSSCGSSREKFSQCILLIADLILVAAVAKGEISDDISEERKKAIRFSLAVLIGTAIGSSTSLAFGPGVGTATTVGSTALVSRELDSWYDMRRRQMIPESNPD